MDLGIPNIFLTNQELLKNSWYFPKFLKIPDIPNKVDTYGFIVLTSPPPITNGRYGDMEIEISKYWIMDGGNPFQSYFGATKDT